METNSDINADHKEIALSVLAERDKPLLRNLLELYAYDFTEFDNSDISEYGEYGYQRLDCYWYENGRRAFLIRVRGKIAGFILVRELELEATAYNSVAEFFILKKYRKQHIGMEAAKTVFAQIRGNWLVPVMSMNEPAQIFWEKVIQELKLEYKIIELKSWEGPVFMFRL